MKLPNIKDARKRTKDKVEYVYLDQHYDDSAYKNKKYFLRTYGCQMNVHDSEEIAARLESLGFKETNTLEEADIIILNTCAIRENAHDKLYGFLGRCKHVKSLDKNKIIGICGCMAQEEGVISYRRDSDIKAWVNIQYGCDKFCTYCIVPYTRGKQRSRHSKEIIQEVKDLVKKGYKEVTLLGQNVNAYGKDLEDELSFAELLQKVADTGIDRVRFVTSHPWDFTDEMIDVIAKNDNIMNYIHLPLQSGSNSILRKMGRRYTKEEYIELFKKIKNKINDVSITTDIIVGFPNETEEDFNDTLDVVNTCKYDSAFTFIYSPREGTPAAQMEDSIDLKTKEERLHKLNELVNKYSLENNKKYEGKTVKVLIEGISEKDDNKVFGYTETMKLVNVINAKEDIGKIIDVKITDAKSFSLDGEKI